MIFGAVLDTRDILDPSVGESVRKAGEKQYHNFDEGLVKMLYYRCNLQMLSHSPPEPPSKVTM